MQVNVINKNVTSFDVSNEILTRFITNPLKSIRVIRWNTRTNLYGAETNCSLIRQSVNSALDTVWRDLL